MNAVIQDFQNVEATGVLTPVWPNSGQNYIPAPGGHPFAFYALQVKGVGAAASSWSVEIDGSLDGVNFTEILTHSSVDGSCVWETTGKNVLFIRINVTSLTLGSASSISVQAVAVPR